MLKHDIIIEIIVIFVWRQVTVNPRWLKTFVRGTKNGYEIFNPIFVFLIFS